MVANGRPSSACNSFLLRTLDERGIGQLFLLCYIGEVGQLPVVEGLIANGRLKKNDSGTFKTRGTILIHRPNALNRPCQGRVLCGNQDACLASYVRALFEPSTLADLPRSVDAEASSKHCSPKCRPALS